jgi:uncharacterized protein
VIVDSGPLLAALNERDRLHELAARTLRQARRVALVPDPVIIEVDIIARRWLGGASARAFLAAIAAGVHTRVPLSDALWRRAVAVDRSYGDLNLGLVDTAVMAVAEDRDLPVFTFDFRAFRAVPGPHGGQWPLALEERDLPTS